MRLIKLNPQGGLSLTEDLDNAPPYAILSHTWGADYDEVTYVDVQDGKAPNKAGYAKLDFCAEQARKDGIDYCWVDTCCINKANLSELSEAITSMFRWYQNATKCYVYMSDVSTLHKDHNGTKCNVCVRGIQSSRWFTRGWTLQELLAPPVVEFFSQERVFLGSKTTLVQQIYDITGVAKAALTGTPLEHFSVSEKMQWAAKRQTKRPEDRAYSLLGIFDVFLPLIYGEGDNAFSRLREAIDKRYGASAQLNPIHWCVPRSANPFFTGREKILQDLESCVRDAVNNSWNGSQCQIVISGIGGQGKSEICLQLARRVRHMFWAVLWIDVSTTDSAERSFLDLAEKLSIPAQTWEDARQGIANLKQPWLLLLDNADELDIDYQDFFPDGPLGVVMLTTRNDDCQQYATAMSIPLQGLERSEARDLLLKSARVPRDRQDNCADDAQRVIRLLQFHPLALIQAGAYVSRGHCTLGEYPRVYDAQRHQLLCFRPRQARSRYGDVYTTFEVSINTLRTLDTQAAKDALQLLPLLAMCGSTRLPQSLFEAAWHGVQGLPSNIASDAVDDEVELLTSWHVSQLPAFLGIGNAVWNQFRLTEAVAILKALSLISIDTYDGTLGTSMHSLVHAWARDRQDDSEQQRSWLQMGCVVSFALSGEALSREHHRWLQLRIEALSGNWDTTKILTSGPTVLIARVVVHFGWFLKRMRADVRLFELTQKMLRHFGLDPQNVKQAWIGLYDLVAYNLLDCGKVKDAVALLEQVVKIRKQSLAEDHPSRLASQHALAGAYRANGQVKEAVALLEQVVEIKEQSLAKDHPSRLVSQHELAGAYRANGQVKEAVAVLEQVVEIKEQSLAEDHSDQLFSEQEN